MKWLIVCRAFQGLGGGSIIGLTNIVISDIVPLAKRGAYGGYIGGTWGIASVLGPILGGLLADVGRVCVLVSLADQNILESELEMVLLPQVSLKSVDWTGY